MTVKWGEPKFTGKPYPAKIHKVEIGQRMTIEIGDHGLLSNADLLDLLLELGFVEVIDSKGAE